MEKGGGGATDIVVERERERYPMGGKRVAIESIEIRKK